MELSGRRHPPPTAITGWDVGWSGGCDPAQEQLSSVGCCQQARGAFLLTLVWNERKDKQSWEGHKTSLKQLGKVRQQF